MLRVVWNPDLRRSALEFISLSKPARVYEQVIQHFSTAMKIEHAGAASASQLVRVHDLDYVTDIFDCRVPNGFGKTNSPARGQLEQILAANGVMIRAALLAIDNPKDVIFAPVGGFHHAGYAQAEGFCTFNGLAAAIANARLVRTVKDILIIDGDIHYGNGTDEIVRRLGWAGVLNLTHTKQLDEKTWEPTIRGVLTNRSWDLVIYQAGADAHRDDPMGCGYLDEYGWEARDRMIFQYCHRLGLPLVFNLAGGYNEATTIGLHLETVRTAERCYRTPIPA